MAKAKNPTITIRPDQNELIKELALAKWGIRHGNRSRWVREAIDEKIEREKHGMELEATKQ